MVESHPLLAGLNPEQLEAVCRTEGPVLVLAGAGSGKTRVVTTRIAWLLASGRAKPGEILAVTFTNKAAEEMRDRVAAVAGRAAAAGLALSTFHSFCVRVLRAEIEHLGYRRNFTIASESDARTLLRRTVQDLDGVRESFDPDLLRSRIGDLKSGGNGAAATSAPETETQAKYTKWLPEVYDRYQSALRAANALDFDDLLLLTLKLWEEHPRVLARYQERFRYVMVDEYQDTNRVQYGLLMALAARRRNLCVVGDDDQSIYSWRGASIENILSFERDFSDAAVIKLEQNYRSTQCILKAANAVIAHNQARRSKNLWSRLGKGAPVVWFVTGDEEHEAREALRWMQAIRQQTGAAYDDFALLYRSNLQSRPFEIALRQAGVPYVVLGGQEFYERAEVKDIVAYLKLMVNPRDEAAFLRVVNVPRRGIGDTTLHAAHELCRTEGLGLEQALKALRQRGSLPSNTEAGIGQFLEIQTRFRKAFRECQGRLAHTASALVDAIGYRAELSRTCKTGEQFQARWTNVEALLSSLEAYESGGAAGRGGPTLSGFLDECSLATGDDRRNRDARRRGGVTLLTIHSAKGLEFPFVFIVGMEEGLLPHEKSVEPAALEEERRLFYVALTRGKRHVTLFEALSRDRHGRARMRRTSRFIGEIPPELLDRRIRAAADLVKDRVAPDPKPVKRPRKRRSQ